MPHIGEQRYAVVSCHVERPLDDVTWTLFARLQERRPGGFPIAALLRPPDLAAGEPEGPWLERAHEAAGRGPLGHHTHFGGVAQARPVGPGAVERVRREAAWLRSHGLEPLFFCGGAWYLDPDVADTLAELGYADCTATAFRPAYLPAGAPRVSLSEPAWLRLPGGRRLLELPTTHSLGMLARAVVRPRALREPVVHAYFHDTDLLDPNRRAALVLALRLLGRRRRPTDLLGLALEADPAETDFDRVYAVSD
jgi:hypothetical protein